MDTSELSALLGNCGFANLKEIKNSASRKAELNLSFEFTDTIEGVETNFILGFDKDFPLTLPQYFIKAPDEYAHIPHIEGDGKICYTHEDYVFLDHENPEGVIKETFKLAKDTIAQGLRKENVVDFSNEFEAYWYRIEGCEHIMGCTEFLDLPTVIKVMSVDKMRMVITDNIDMERFTGKNEKKPVQVNAVLIPLSRQNLIPPRYNEKISIDYLKSLVKMLSANSMKALERIINTKGQTSYVFFTFIQPNGNKSIFGVHFKGNGAVKCLTDPDAPIGEIVPISINRLDKEYMFKRGSNSGEPHSKKILLIGAGSVGGFLADELVRSGFFDITVVDHGAMGTENCYRHVTGYAYRGRNKAEALKQKIEMYYPHTKINAINGKIEDLIGSRKLKLEEFDLVVYATGSVTVNIFLAKLHKEKKVPTFYAWNDPYGIGGHCLITNVDAKGCYECLYSGTVFHNRASFAAANQPKPFLKSVSGCGSFYTPYSGSDSTRTALLTLQAIQDVVEGKEKTNGIRSWKGPSTVFDKEGYVLSDRYSLAEAELLKNNRSIYVATCKTCNSK